MNKKNIFISKITIKNLKKSILIGFIITFIHQFLIKEVDYDTEYTYSNDTSYNVIDKKTYLIISFPNGYNNTEEVVSDGSNYTGFVQGLRVVLNCFYSTFFSKAQVSLTSFLIFLILYFFQKFRLRIE